MSGPTPTNDSSDPSDAPGDFNAPTVPPDDGPSSAPGSGTPASGAPEFDDAEKYLGRIVGGVKLDRMLGAGGMGAVFVGEHQRLGKQVAIKILPKGLARERERAERFLREARAAAKLEHPNIVGVFDVGEETDVWFIAMRYVEGESSAGAVRRAGPLPVPEVLRIIRGVASALEAAHRRSIVHRDVKPENVLLGTDDEVLLADFGLVRDLESNTQLSQSGQILGTPAYMSPEQARGEKVDHRSDIYSLGTTAYYLATALPPFQAETAIATALKHIMDDAVPPSEEQPGIPRAFDAFVERLMAKQPDNRPASATAVIDEIDALLHGGLEQAPSSDRSRTGLAIVGGAALTIAALVLVGVAMSGSKKPPAKAPRTTRSAKPPAKPTVVGQFSDPKATEREMRRLLEAKRWDEAIALAGAVIRTPGVPDTLLDAAERAHIAAKQQQQSTAVQNVLYARVSGFRSVVLDGAGDDGLAPFVPPAAAPIEVEMVRALLRLTPAGIKWGGKPRVGPMTADEQGRRVAVVVLPFRRRARPEAGVIDWALHFVQINEQWYPRFGGIESTVKPALLLTLDRLFVANARDRKRMLQAEMDASLQARGVKPGSREYGLQHGLMVRALQWWLNTTDRAELFEYQLQQVQFDLESRVATAEVRFRLRMPNQQAKESVSTYHFKLVAGRWLWWKLQADTHAGGRPKWAGGRKRDGTRPGKGARGEERPKKK